MINHEIWVEDGCLELDNKWEWSISLLLSKEKITAKLFIIITLFTVNQITNLIEGTEEDQNDILVESIEGRLEQEIENTQVSVSSIANIPEVQETFAGEDRDRLENMLSSSFKSVEDEVAQMQFHTVDSDSFLRLHMPERYGDSLADFRDTVNTANETQEEAIGIERGVGGYGIRVVSQCFTTMSI